MSARRLTIAVDFSGTLTGHARFPAIGFEVPGAIDVVQALQSAGHRVILSTTRTGGRLAAALEWCRRRGVTFYAVNENPDQFRDTSRKLWAHVYIDDCGIGTPLRRGRPGTKRSVVDWARVRVLLERRGIL